MVDSKCASPGLWLRAQEHAHQSMADAVERIHISSWNRGSTGVKVLQEPGFRAVSTAYSRRKPHRPNNRFAGHKTLPGERVKSESQAPVRECGGENQVSRRSASIRLAGNLRYQMGSTEWMAARPGIHVRVYIWLGGD